MGRSLLEAIESAPSACYSRLNSLSTMSTPVPDGKQDQMTRAERVAAHRREGTHAELIGLNGGVQGKSQFRSLSCQWMFCRAFFQSQFAPRFV